MNILRSTTPAQAGERYRLADRQPGPVTVAIRAIRSAEPLHHGVLGTLVAIILGGRS